MMMWASPWSSWRTAVILAAIWLAVIAASGRVCARTAPDPATIPFAELPAEAQSLLASIAEGGPFPYQRDGIVFGNRETLLPPHSHGYYHEYTVPTPGVKTRGARRIICGGAKRSVAECYYSNDHYQSFRRILR
jgi:ribonuclease T1